VGSARCLICVSASSLWQPCRCTARAILGTKTLEANDPPPASSPGECDLVGDVLGVLVLPDVDDGPPEDGEACVGTSIASSIVADLGRPEMGIGLRGHRVPRTTVPEAAVDKHDESRPDQDDVWSSGQVALMEAEAHASSVKCTPQIELRCRVAAWEPAHELPHSRAGSYYLAAGHRLGN
jgi:hypothetical protein